ncbi:structural constituent of ribosome [Tieghemiomyces parasiticus]|uniref:Small ribosomal subunit protein uS2 n=1 Tax=Tieghemiomyces parasiticus TaxID=78921 RepID=A0A9W8DUF3_9FUNG|nr:structural constituent of ribosome [Tieghemiomyces parasiticus]
MTNLPACLNPTQDDILRLLAAKAHLGSQNATKGMSTYLWKRRDDGVHILNVGKTWEKLVLAARIIAAVENPADVAIISSRSFALRGTHKFAIHTGAQAIAGQFTPGTFTNYITRSFKEPRVIVVCDPIADHQAIREASYVNIPVIAFCNADAPLTHVDVAIPINTAGKHSMGLGLWMLAREVLRLRGTLKRQEEWNIVVDMFFHRDAEDAEKEALEKAEKEESGKWEAAGETAEWDAPIDNSAPGQWDGAAPEWATEGQAGDWAAETQQTTAAAPGWDA